MAEEVITPDEFATGRRDRSRVGSHLRLKREGEVICVAEVEVAGEI